MKATAITLTSNQLISEVNPLHEPDILCCTFEHSNSLRQTVDAYATNIDGFGHRLECTINFDAENAGAEVAKSLRLEAMAKGESCAKPSRRDTARRLRELENLAEAERARLDDILKPGPLPPIHRSLAPAQQATHRPPVYRQQRHRHEPGRKP